VGEEGLEPSCLTTYASETYAATSYATRPLIISYAPGGIRTPNNRFEACRDIHFTTGAVESVYQNLKYIEERIIMFGVTSGCRLMVGHVLAKDEVRVRFPVSAPMSLT
jgi:hypothetical protein